MPSTASPAAAKREQQRNARRDAILAAARSVFARKGYDGATIADIAGEAGVASGTVYLYYSSKVDLFAALNITLFKMINEAMARPDAPADLVGGTRARIHAIFEACDEHRDLVRLIFLNPDPRSEVARRLKRADEERLRPLVELLGAGMDAGTIRRGDAKLLARLINGLVITALFQCLVQSDGRQIHEYEDAVVDMVAGALAPR